MGTQKLSMMLGASAPSSGTRDPLDYYATEPAALESFLNQFEKDKLYLSEKIWEPACGGGHLSNVLLKKGYNVLSTDIAVRYDGANEYDFLKPSKDMFWSGDILTNPPFKYVESFLRNGLKLVKEGNYVILLQRIMFLESSKRYKLFQEFPPKYVYVHSSRIAIAKSGDFKKYEKGGRSMCFAWYVWEKGFEGEPRLRWIP
jgi:hypothetical protein